MKKIYHYLRYVFLFEIVGSLFQKQDPVLLQMKNKYKGRRCFVVATGPSLISRDLEMLKDEITFGVNSIFLMYPQTSWRPAFYVCTDAPYFEKLVDSYGITAKDLCTEHLFLNRNTLNIAAQIGFPSNVSYICFSPWNRIYDFKGYKYQPNINKGMYAFGTVTNIVINIAMYMGFQEIYLIGTDCSNLNQHFVNDVTDADKDDMYVKNVIKAQLQGYKIMKHEASKRNTCIYNATRGGALEVFPRVDLDELLSDK